MYTLTKKQEAKALRARENYVNILEALLMEIDPTIALEEVDDIMEVGEEMALNGEVLTLD